MTKLLRRTKIIATIGPASNSIDCLTAMIKAGVDLVRVNFSHGQHKQQVQLIELARKAALNADKEIGIIADLQGPKIRVGQFKNSFIELRKSQIFILDCMQSTPGDETSVGVDYQTLYQDVEPNCSLLLDDGLIELKVERIENKKIYCKVIIGGRLSDNKGINKK